MVATSSEHAACARCGDCCRSVRVPVTGADLSRLAAPDAAALLSYLEWLAPSDVDMTGEPETWVRLPEGRRLLVLRHGADGCCFLEANCCSVYRRRPAACQAYPYCLGSGLGQDLVQRMEGVSCHSHPRVLSLEALRAHATELHDYAERVQQWNRRQRRRLRFRLRPESPAAFLRFVAIVA